MAIGPWNESVSHLIPGYRHTRRVLEISRRRFHKIEKKADREDKAAFKAQKELLGGMIVDCEFALEWMRIGGNPDRRRGTDKQGVYARSWDPAWIDSYSSPNGWYTDRTEFSGELTDEQRFRIEEAMRDLSVREKQCFMLYHVDGMSLRDIAVDLSLAKSTVQTNIERASEKIKYAKLNSLFLLE